MSKEAPKSSYGALKISSVLQRFAVILKVMFCRLLQTICLPVEMSSTSMNGQITDRRQRMTIECNLQSNANCFLF